MKVRILRPALEDLATGREFYDRQESGIGGYFFDSLFTEIDSLVLFAGIHRSQFGYQRRGVFRTRSTIASLAKRQLSTEFSIVEGIRSGFEVSYEKVTNQSPRATRWHNSFLFSRVAHRVA